MRLCFIGDANSIHMERWARWFADEHEVHLLTDHPRNIEGVHIHTVGGGSGKMALYSKARESKRIINELRPDVLHAHYAFGYGTMGAYSGYRPFIISIWGSDVTIDSHGLLNKIVLKYTLGKADFISSFDSNLRARLSQLGFKSNVRKMRMSGIDTTMFNPDSFHESDAPAVMRGSDLKILCIRPLRDSSNIETLIEALPAVAAEIPTVKLGLIWSEGNNHRKLMELADETGVAERIQYIGSLDHEDMPRYLATADLIVDPYVSVHIDTDEHDQCPGLSTTSMEAMACGTPVMILKREGMRSDCPYATFKGDDPGSLAEAIIDVISQERYKELSRRGIEYIRDNAEMGTVMTKWEQFYENIISHASLISPEPISR